jgi:hypothetical protein
MDGSTERMQDLAQSLLDCVGQLACYLMPSPLRKYGLIVKWYQNTPDRSVERP